MGKKNKRLSFITLSLMVLVLVFLVIMTSNKVLKFGDDEKNLSLQKIGDSGQYNTGIAGLDENFFESDELGIGVFWSDKFVNDEKEIRHTLNKNLELYVTNDGKKFTYIGETGVTGRDPNIMYKNGVFYMATTKGGSASGKITFNIFKSIDLIHWTNGTKTEYRYEPSLIPNNKFGITCNTWSPKFFNDGDDMYILVSAQRFDTDGSTYYYIKGDKENLDKYGLSYIKKEEITEDGIINEKIYYNDQDDDASNDQEINTSKGVLVKETPVSYETKDGAKKIEIENGNFRDGNLDLDENGNIIDKTTRSIIYNKSDIKLITKKEFSLNQKGDIINITCPWYEPVYNIFDSYIAKIDGIGTESEQKDINCQNLSFGEFKKVNFKDRPYNESHSMLGGYLIKSSSNKYVMYTKTDPYGTVQRWVSDKIDGEWKIKDDRFYASNVNANSTESVVCNAKEKYNNIDVFKKHFEGSFFSNFGENIIFYSDHYISNDKSEVGENPNADSKNNISGTYYSIVDKDLGSNEHLRYADFIKLTTLNTNMRPSIVGENSNLRNGSIIKISDDASDVLKNACNFNISVDRRAYNANSNKSTVVLKSNRALNLPKDSEWKYVSKDMYFDTNVPDSLKKIYISYYYVNSFGDKNIDKKTNKIPYSTDNESYIYKVYDKNTGDEEVTLSDKNNNTSQIIIDNALPVIHEITLSNFNYTNKDVYINIKCSDSCSGIVRYRITGEDGEEQNVNLDEPQNRYGVSSPKPITRNGIYHITVWDNIGNETTKDIVIANIDKTAPVISSANSSNITENSFDLDIKGKDQESGISKIRVYVNGELKKTYEYTEDINTEKHEIFTMDNLDKNTTYTYYIEVEDNAGNITSTRELNSSVKTNKQQANVEFSINPDTWTNDKVLVTVTPKVQLADGNKIQYSVVGMDGSIIKEYTDYTEAISVNENCMIKVRTTDGINVSDEIIYNIRNIDKTAIVATIKYDKNYITDSNVTATITFNKENVKIKNNEGKNVYTFEQNGSFTFEYVDEAGNEGSAKAEVDWIKKENVNTNDGNSNEVNTGDNGIMIIIFILIGIVSINLIIKVKKFKKH